MMEASQCRLIVNTTSTNCSPSGSTGSSSGRSWAGRTTTPKKVWRREPDRVYDVYAAYCEDDQDDILPFLQAFRQNDLEVYDPNLDALATETLIQAWLENGINKSKTSVIFLTKQFTSSSVCRYQAEHAVMRYAVTRGRHRVVVVMLKSCKIPKNLQHFNCVYAWKFKEEPIEQYRRILNAIFAPRRKFRRGSLILTNSSCPKLDKTKCTKLIGHTKKGFKKNILFYKDLLLNINRVKFALENCELKCLSSNCTFQVEGHRVLEFYEHVQVCGYQQVTCKFCRQDTFRKNLHKHEQNTCRNRLVPCPNEFCARKLAVRDMESHLRVCSYKEEMCPNRVHGCYGIYARKDKEKHFEICDYVTVQCKKCNEPVFRIDVDQHTCRKQRMPRNAYKENNFYRPDEMYKCKYDDCDFQDTKAHVEAHENTCEFRLEQCSDCGLRLPQRDLAWHQRECDQMTECSLCHQVVPSSCKQTHDLWECSLQNVRAACERCGILTCADRLEKHQESCTAVVTMPAVPSPADEKSRHRTDSESDAQTDTNDDSATSEPVPIPRRRNQESTDLIQQVIEGIRKSPQEIAPLSAPKYSGGMPVISKWTPNSRQKWRVIMELAVASYAD